MPFEFCILKHLCKFVIYKKVYKLELNLRLHCRLCLTTKLPDVPDHFYSFVGGLVELGHVTE